MATLTVNMKQFNAKFKWYAENCPIGDSVVRSKGKILTLDARPYLHWLNMFNIFYTMVG